MEAIVEGFFIVATVVALFAFIGFIAIEIRDAMYDPCDGDDL
jgi:hypothetical protein